MNEYDGRLRADINTLFFGRPLGFGVDRDVYEYAPNPMEYVLKIQRTPNSFQNVIEWETWQEVCGTKWEKWFAPVVSISEGGMAMIQMRTFPPAELPERLPNFFIDVQPENFGVLGGEVVAHDYGLTALASSGLKAAKMKKVRWERDDSEKIRDPELYGPKTRAAGFLG